MRYSEDELIFHISAKDVDGLYTDLAIYKSSKGDLYAKPIKVVCDESQCEFPSGLIEDLAGIYQDFSSLVSELEEEGYESVKIYKDGSQVFPS